MNGQDRSHNSHLLIIKALNQALSHKLRSALSVLANDLQYLGGRLHDPALDSARRKVGDILATLGLVEDNLAPGITPIKLSTDQLLHEIGGEVPSSLPNATGWLWADPEQCRRGFKLLTSLLEALKLTPKISVGAAPQALEICYNLGHLPDLFAGLKGRRFDSLSAALTLELGLDLLQPALIDSLFLAQGCIMQLVCEECLSLELRFKFVKDAVPGGVIGG